MFLHLFAASAAAFGTIILYAIFVGIARSAIRHWDDAPASGRVVALLITLVALAASLATAALTVTLVVRAFRAA